jgi:Mn-dependent DtxR family transcriptional regulator
LLKIPLVTTTARKPKNGILNRSESTEDHLERIQELIEHKGYARVADLAASLQLSTSAVSNMVRRLARRGYVNYERYRGFTLTSSGRQVAQHVKARHNTLTDFLEIVGLDSGTVEREVEEIEHHLRPETLVILSKLVSFWREHPDQLNAFKRYAHTPAEPEIRNPKAEGRPAATARQRGEKKSEIRNPNQSK